MKTKGELSFDWLESLIGSVKARDFFSVEGAVPADLRQQIESSSLAVPHAYKRFAIRFGTAKLFKQRDTYLVTVFASPREVDFEGEDLLAFGATDLSTAFFKRSQLREDGGESPVFERNPDDGLHEAYSGFEQWLKEECRIARKQFSKKKWREMELGPEPFSEDEMSVVRARQAFEWKVIGVAEDGDILFQVFNGSDRRLPFLTIGVRGKKIGTGGVWLPVAGIAPGHRGTIKRECYKGHEPPESLNFFDKPEPTPDEKDRYWEFRKLAHESGV